jgi:hypothetical protein
MFVLDDVVVYSASDLAVAAGCEYALLRAFDARLGRGPKLAADDELLARTALLGGEHEKRHLDKLRAQISEEPTVITAAETLATSKDTPQIETIHLLGAAEGKKGDWRPLSEAVTGVVYNYFSTNDSVLKYLFAAAQAGSVAVGLRGFTTKFATIKDRDVSTRVNGHSEYFQNVRLA